MTEQRKIHIGDRVILKEAVITHTYQGNADKDGRYQITFDDETSTSVFGCHVETVLPAPWEPKVGDNVFYVQRDYYKDKHYCPYTGVTLIGVHSAPQNWEMMGKPRKWAIVAYKGDIPHGIYYEDLRETKPE